MSRVHDALRKAAHEKPEPARPAVSQPVTAAADAEHVVSAPSGEPGVSYQFAPAARSQTATDLERLEEIVEHVSAFPFKPSPDALIVSPLKPKEAPSEEFRSLRTRLNHLQRSQSLHTLVVSSASPGEGKSFTACNLAMSQAQLAGKRILLADFDFRRPSIAKVFGIKGTLGLTEYLRGQAALPDIIHRLADTNLYIITAGESVSNPLELLNLKECGDLLDGLRDHFDWVILDSPPLLFAADGNLLSTMADGTILVVRIGETTFDSVTRALQSLCENNVLGIVVNGAHRGELYSRYSYYYEYFDEPDKNSPGTGEDTLVPDPVGVDVR